MVYIKNLKNSIIYADCASFYDVDNIDIDKDRIELNDNNGMVIGIIDYNNVWDEIGIIHRNDNGDLTGKTTILFENGEATEEWEKLLKQ